MATIKGTIIPEKQPNRRTFVKGQGWVTTEAWESNSQTAIEGKAADLVAGLYTRVEITARDNGATWRVEASIEGEGEGTPPDPTDTWENDATTQGADIINHPTFANIESTELSKVLNAVNNPEQFMSTSPALTDPNAAELYWLMIRGIKQYAFDMPILRHIQTPAVDASIDGVQRVWTFADLPTMTPIVSAIALAAYNNNPFGTVDAGDLAGQTWGWLRQHPRITEDVFGRSSMTEEWWLGLWPVSIYPEY